MELRLALLSEVLEWAWCGWFVYLLALAHETNRHPTMFETACFGVSLFYFLPWSVQHAIAATKERRRLWRER